MDVRDLFLDQHAAMHSVAVGGNKMSAAERTFTGLTDEQMRVRPRADLNSLAWLMWHIARAEDIMVNTVLAGRPQVFDDTWKKRLGITRPDFGIGMTSAEVTQLTGRSTPARSARTATRWGSARASWSVASSPRTGKARSLPRPSNGPPPRGPSAFGPNSW